MLAEYRTAPVRIVYLNISVHSITVQDTKQTTRNDDFLMGSLPNVDGLTRHNTFSVESQL